MTRDIEVLFDQWFDHWKKHPWMKRLEEVEKFDKPQGLFPSPGLEANLRQAFIGGLLAHQEIFNPSELMDCEGKYRFLGGRSPQWTQLEIHHLAKEGFCRACGGTNLLQVHHLIPIHINQRGELDPQNLITLCQPHHLLIGHLMRWSDINEQCVGDAQYLFHKIQTRKENKP